MSNFYLFIKRKKGQPNAARGTMTETFGTSSRTRTLTVWVGTKYATITPTTYIRNQLSSCRHSIRLLWYFST